MPGLTSGLQRDINLVRRRAWLFIPFLFVGILAALFIGRLAGNANAVATMQLAVMVQLIALASPILPEETRFDGGIDQLVQR